MHDIIARTIARTLQGAVIAALVLVAPASRAATLPDPAIDPASTTATAVLAGGCFWGMQAVFKHVKGVTHVTAGYSGGSREDSHYQSVGSGTTGHAESVQIEYDPTRVSFGQLLKVFFAVAHDPTQLNRQGPDVGTEYRSAIFFATPEQQRVAQAYIAQLQSSEVFARPIVTEVAPLTGFYPAESYHQNYAELHPDSPYIIINDLPKIANLQKQFAALYVAK
ncbi:MAG TPA: peptide-methionine (S)-S-oxide reductase MsrA [Stellaceae bacterium]|nr:peptide-methionine (S)-S-oxide reductase MsrA [Stellaceae bacterium]